MATISTHNGTEIARGHNIRDKKIVEKENHIDPNGWHEIWLDIKPEDAYKEVFEEYVVEYNDKQKRNDRKITNYYQKIKKDKKKHAVYEMICGVYDDSISPEEAWGILYEYANGFETRNPRLKVIGKYFHADEEGKAPHIHIDYFPVAEMTRGMRLQNSLAKALEQQGCMAGEHINETAQIAFEHKENKALEKICNNFGLNVEHPQRDTKVSHLNTNVYKERKALEKDVELLQDEEHELNNQIRHLTKIKSDLEATEPLYYKTILDIVIGFILNILWNYLPEKIKEKFSSVFEVETYSQLRKEIKNCYDMEFDYEYEEPDITD